MPPTTDFPSMSPKKAAAAAKGAHDPAAKEPKNGELKPSAAQLKKLHGNVEATIKALDAGFSTDDDHEAALWLLAELEATPALEAFFPDYLPKVLDAVGSKKTAVRGAGEAALRKVFKVSSLAASLELESLIEATADERAWQTRAAALRRLEQLAQTDPSAIASFLPLVVPAVTACLWDTKPQVAAAARDAMKESFALCGNRDIEPVLPALASCAIRPREVPECVHALSATTFVQSVDAATLAVVVPLLARALGERGAGATALKRQAALIICNMSLLVDDARDAAPFLPKLLPGLAKLADEMADPEARAVCERSVALMRKLEARCAGVAAFSAVAQAVDARGLRQELVGAETPLRARARWHASKRGAALAARRNFEAVAWTAALSPALTACFPGGVSEAVEAARLVAVDVSALKEARTEDDDDVAEELCNCTFTLAYGTKTLLHSATLRLKRGYKYGLLGANDSGKTTLMRSIANGQLEGFPPADEVRTVFVEADILGELSHLPCLDYIFNDARIQACKVDRDAVAAMMLRVGFTKKMLNDSVTTLSGGWRMKLAMSRAMLQRADILLLDEPTNHLDVMNVKWVKDYLKSLKDVTCIMVSHDSGLLNDVCDHIIEIADLKLDVFRGNLSAFVKVRPEARSYFELKSSKLKFAFPKPGPIEGVKSKGKALIKVDKCAYRYPINDQDTIEKATVQVSLSSRVACVGPNGAGKSTLIKVLTGEVEPTKGVVWQHPNARMGYIAQHAFHHIESHLNKTPNEYIRWRYAGGDDREAIAKDTMQLSDSEKAAQQQQIEWVVTDPETEKVTKSKRVIARLTGERKTDKATKEHAYEIQWKAPYEGDLHRVYLPIKKLIKYGWAKSCKKVDVRVAQAASGLFRPLTSTNVELHLKNVGLEAEFATHHRISALSGGQKVKVVLGAAMWMQPHIVILDEPTNYLDRESLGALADAIRGFEGGVVIISHNNDFTTALCPETWVVEKDADGIARPNCQGDPEWMKNALATKCSDQQLLTEVTDAFGNVTEVKTKKTLNKKEQKGQMKKVKDKIKAGLELDEEEEEFANEQGLFAV
ncbi:P-loop containing nucleoside triphosphate hydrolase protein [Pelagophyceae sp. CCMP2097]|nr:P-loop containing nucleoside triphosphate hydrolase protein [Pelagophyceae sp. CCMP2097]